MLQCYYQGRVSFVAAASRIIVRYHELAKRYSESSGYQIPSAHMTVLDVVMMWYTNTPAQ